MKIRVPEGCGPGSTLILTKAQDATDWDVKVGKCVPVRAADADISGANEPENEPDREEAPSVGEEHRPDVVEEAQGCSPAAAYQRDVFATASPSSAAAQQQLRRDDLQQHWEQQQSDSQQQQQHEQQEQRELQHQPTFYEPVEPQPVCSFDGAVAYTVRLDTTVGGIDIIVRPDWAPHGTRRFLELAAAGDLAELAFYRAIKGCIAQFGLPARRAWPPIPDDPPTGVPFLLGAISFAAIGENSRKSTLFICTGDMSHCLGRNSWETPIGAVAESSLDVLDRIETMYGDIAEFKGPGPDTNRINNEGNAYLRSNFPHLTYIRSAVPLDWRPEADPVLPPSCSHLGGASTRLGCSAQASEFVDQAGVAARAAQEAQAQAAQATQLAQQAAQAEHVAQAAQAAQLAQQAARAAQAAAEAAQAAQQAAQQQASLTPSGYGPHPPYTNGHGGCEACHDGSGGVGASWRPPRCQSDAVDVPVEVKMPARPGQLPMAVPAAPATPGPHSVVRNSSMSAVPAAAGQMHAAPTAVLTAASPGPSCCAAMAAGVAGNVAPLVPPGAASNAVKVHMAPPMQMQPHPQPHLHALPAAPGAPLLQVGSGGSLQFQTTRLQLTPTKGASAPFAPLAPQPAVPAIGLLQGGALRRPQVAMPQAHRA